MWIILNLTDIVNCFEHMTNLYLQLTCVEMDMIKIFVIGNSTPRRQHN